MTKAKKVYQHYPVSEHSFIDSILDKLKGVQRSNRPYLTDFLDPRQESIVCDLVAQAGLSSLSSQETLTVEYHRVLIFSDAYGVSSIDLDLALLAICYSSRFQSLSHPQIMGTLLHQLGLKRSAFGDILVLGNKAQVIIKRSMLDYFQSSVTKIAKCPVTLEEVSFTERLQPYETGQDKLILVSSLRLDKVLAAAYGLSRKTAQQLIAKDKAKQNHRTALKPTDLVQVGDLLSLRGYGRIRVLENKGQSTKGKYKLVIKK